MRRHRCAPIWLVYSEDHHEDWDDADKVHATDPQQAAEKWAADDDCQSGEYSIVAGTDATVQVRRQDLPASEPAWMVVTGESVPEYHAHQANHLRCNKCRGKAQLDPEQIGKPCEACASQGFAWAKWEAA